MESVGPATTVGELLDRWPAILEVFSAFHLGSSRGAHLPRPETLERLAARRGVPLDMLLEALRGWIEEHGAAGR